MKKRERQLTVPGLETLGVCHKDAAKRVTYQNKACRSYCGQRQGQICTDRCMPLYDHSPLALRPQTGMCALRSQCLDHDFYDVVFIRNEMKTLTTLLYPQNANRKKMLEQARLAGLTQRELLIASHLLTGVSNSDIAHRLGISPGTLKSHLNHIYRKAPSLRFYRS